ncbi:MAG: hypothetical protein RL434_704, partial [Pseudomonadota bacterium]
MTSPRLTELRGGRIYDPANGIDGERRSLFIDDHGYLVAPPGSPAEIKETF